jgi:cytochrome oxidase Cu insertion factor (SCO1/SenC/PrrC family)
MRIAATLMFALVGGGAWAHAEHATAPPAQKEPIAPIPAPPARKATDARAYFTDTVLLTQDGRQVRFYSDVMEGRTVLINVIYTNCKDACPIIVSKLNETRALVGDYFGRDIFFITLTSDPDRDSPGEMKSFAGRQSADVPGWTWLTGGKPEIEFVLKRLGQFSKHVEEHSTLLIAGNVPGKRWTKIRPDAPADVIAERLRLLAFGGQLAPAAAVQPAGVRR